MRRKLLGVGTLASIAVAGCSNDVGQGEDVSNIDCAALYSQMILETVMPTADNMTEENLRRWLSESEQIMPAKYYIERAKQEMGIQGDGSASGSTVPFAPDLYARMAEIAELNREGRNVDRIDELLRTCEARYHPNETESEAREEETAP